MPTLAVRLRNTLALLLAGVAGAPAQNLPQALLPPPYLLGIAQFGMPGEQQFVVCADSDCPLPSPKQRSPPTPVPAAPGAAAVQVPPTALPPLAAESVARASPRRPAKLRPKPRRRCPCRH